jgi:hypothetical protein
VDPPKNLAAIQETARDSLVAIEENPDDDVENLDEFC